MKPRRFIIVSDIHGSERDEASCNAAVAFAKDFRPDIGVINGDLFDFASLRRGASDSERAQSLAEDWDAGEEFGHRFFRHCKERHFLLGNHDTRVYDLLENTDGRLKDHGRDCVAKLEGWAKIQRAKLYPYDSRLGVLALGHLNVVHGFHCGASACANHSRIYGNVVFGHVHSIESFQTPGLSQQEARAIGCMCKLDLGYINHKTAKLRWANGFVAGLLFPDGSYTLFQARKINGTFHIPTDFARY